MGICGFIFTICESLPADPSCVELAQNCCSLWPALQEVPHSLLDWLSQAGAVWEHLLTGNFCFPTQLQALPRGWGGLHHDPGQSCLASVETEELGRGKGFQAPKEPSLKDVMFCWLLVPFSLSCPCIQQPLP